MHPLAPEQARARHASGRLYTAVASQDEHSAPELRVEMRLESGYSAVIFMDELGGSNWEPVPNFGAYDALIRRDRA